MTVDCGFQTNVETRLEIYLTHDADALHEHLYDGDKFNEFHPPAAGLAKVTVTRDGLRSVEQTVNPFRIRGMDHPNYEHSEFCWYRDIVDPLNGIDEWFNSESVYNKSERGDCSIIEHDFPHDISLSEVGGVTITVTYVTNDRSADDYACRVRLIYGVPWNNNENQNAVVTVLTESLPESIDEVLGVIRIALYNDPVKDIPICLFDEYNYHDRQDKPSSTASN